MSTASNTVTASNPLAALTAGIWTVDASHSHIGFVVRHLVVAKVRGQFNEFTGSITVADNPLQSKVVATVVANSIDTRDEGRDGHLRGTDFFDIEHNPTWSLVSTGIEASGTDHVLHADLTIKGVTKAVDFALEFHGVATDPWGNTKAGFSAATDISRKDFGLAWNVALDAGGFVVADKVSIVLDIEALKG